jgi:plasmid replication initiation protein
VKDIVILENGNQILDRNTMQYKYNIALAQTKTPLTLNESKLVLKVLAQIKEEDKDFKDYEIVVDSYMDNQIQNEFKKIKKQHGNFKIPDKRGDRIRLFCDNLLHKTIHIPLEGEDWLLTNWFSSFEWKDKRNTIFAHFDPKLKPYLLELKEAFGYSNIEYLLTFRSSYSVKFYMLLKTLQSYWYLKVKGHDDEIPLEWFRGWLGLTNEYKKYNDFKRFVLLKAQKELSKSDVSFEFEELKTGRKVTHLKIKKVVLQEEPRKLKKKAKEIYGEDNPDSAHDLMDKIVGFEGKKLLISHKIYTYLGLKEHTRDGAEGYQINLSINNEKASTFFPHRRLDIVLERLEEYHQEALNS